MTSHKSLKVLFLWSRISGYMAASWKRLADYPDIDMTVVAWLPDSVKDHAAFDRSIVDGLNCHLFPSNGVTLKDLNSISAKVQPDVILLPGWIDRKYIAFARQQNRQLGTPIVMAIDSPWRGTAKEILSTLIRRWQIGFAEHVVTAGQRGTALAKKLGFRENQITEGIYAWDENLFAGVAARDHPLCSLVKSNGFLFVGRYVPVKGLTDLLQGYADYRSQVDSPWPLTCCGSGPLESEITKVEGARNFGFQSPSNLPAIMSSSKAFLLPSNYEPWGVALAEAMGAGLPVIATDACGSALDLIVEKQNGRLIPPRDPKAIAEAMVWMHRHGDRDSLSRFAMKSAAKFTTNAWAQRWNQIFRDVAYERA